MSRRTPNSLRSTQPTIATESDVDAALPVRRATIEDVATAASVSVATVSRALRGLPNVADSTRQRVAEAALALDYRPDPAASRLAAGKTKTVTVGIPALNGWYFSTVVAGAEAVCNEAGYEFQVIAVGSHSDRDRLLHDRYRLERRTDGLILVDVAPSPEQVAAVARRGVALTTIGTRVDGCPSVCIDDEHVGELAAEHLIELGHRNLGVISGLNDDPMNFVVPMARRNGFDRAAARHGITLGNDAISNGNFSVDAGRDATAALLDAPTPPTAIFAMSDEMAFGALMELDSRGLIAGRDVSVVGVDDHEFARVVKLTTIRQPIADHGAVAARMLIATMSRNPLDAQAHDMPTSHLASIELISRASTGPAPTDC